MVTSLDSGALKYDFQQIWRTAFRRCTNDSEIKVKGNKWSVAVHIHIRVIQIPQS